MNDHSQPNDEAAAPRRRFQEMSPDCADDHLDGLRVTLVGVAAPPAIPTRAPRRFCCAARTGAKLWDGELVEGS